MYQQYKDIAEFRLIYIREAHAINGTAPHPIAHEKGILNHTNIQDRCATAEMLIRDKCLTIPTLIDSMDNAVSIDYNAHPDRIFVVRTDGRFGAAAEPGPGGFAEGLEDARNWLAQFKMTGREPEISKEALKALEAALEWEKRLVINGDTGTGNSGSTED